MNVADVKQLSGGDPVWDLRGTVAKAFETKTGGEGDRTWRRLDFWLRDPTGEIRVAWFSPSIDHTELQGQTVLVTANKKSDNAAPRGAMANVHNNQVSVKASAYDVKIQDPSGTPQTAAQLQAHGIPPKVAQQQGVRAPDGRPTIDDFEHVTSRLAAQMAEIFDAALGREPATLAMRAQVVGSWVATGLIAWTNGKLIEGQPEAGAFDPSEHGEGFP